MFETFKMRTFASEVHLREFVNTKYVNLNKPIWKGVLCHLMGDKAFYYK